MSALSGTPRWCRHMSPTSPADQQRGCAIKLLLPVRRVLTSLAVAALLSGCGGRRTALPQSGSSVAMPTPPAAPPHLSGPPTVLYKPAPAPKRPSVLNGGFKIRFDHRSAARSPRSGVEQQLVSQSKAVVQQYAAFLRNNGAFRRVFSNAGLFYMREISCPVAPKMPVGGGPNRDTGYVYMEGWPGAGSSNSEVGLIYAAKSNTYMFYYSSLRGDEGLKRSFSGGCDGCRVSQWDV